MTRADFERRMMALLIRADELAAGFLALDAELRSLARAAYRDPSIVSAPAEPFPIPEEPADV